MDQFPFQGAKGRLSCLMEHERDDSQLNNVCHSDELLVLAILPGSEDKSSSNADDMTMASGELPPPPPRSPSSPWSHSPVLHSPSASLFHTCIASLRRLEGCVHSIALSKALVFTSSDSHRIRVWSSNECADLGYVKVKSGEIRSILCHGNMIFSAHKDCKVRIWNFSANVHFKKITTLPKRNPFFSFPSKSNHQLTHHDKISCMAYNHVEGLLYTGSWDRTVKVWNILDRICEDTIYAHEDTINAILVDHEGSSGSVFTCSSDGSIKIWYKAFGECIHTLIMVVKFPYCSINALALISTTNDHHHQTNHFKTSILYAGSSDGKINFWIKDKDSSRYNHGGVFQGHSFAVLCLTTIDNLLLSGSEDTMIRVWKREERESKTCTHACLAVIQGHRGPVKCIAACPDSAGKSSTTVKGFLVYTSGFDKSFKVWRIRVMADEGSKSKDTIISDNYQPRRSLTENHGDDQLLRITSMKYGRSESCDPRRSSFENHGNDQSERSTTSSTRYGRRNDESCDDPVLSPAWVKKRLSGAMS